MSSSSIQHKYIIIKDRIEIYKDFTISLINYIIGYYLDKDTLSADVDIKNHYNWCFNKVCDEFKLEGIEFGDNDMLREYFYDFFYYQFYKRNNIEITIQFYEKFWTNIFNYDKQKNKNVISTMIELYNVFDKSINTEKNILEIV